MSEKVKHFNKATVFGRLKELPEKKLSNEGKGRPFWRITVVCANSQHGTVLAYGRIWDPKKAADLIAYFKKDSTAGVKLVGFLNQYDHEEKEKNTGKVIATVRRSNFTWYDWFPDKCEQPRASFILTGKVEDIKDDLLLLHLEREGSDPEDFEVHVLTMQQLKGLTEGDVVKVKGYIRSREAEDEFGDSTNSPIRPYIESLELREGDFA